MKRSLVVMATVVGLSLLGCGGVTPSEERQEDATVSQLSTCDTLPVCDSLHGSACKPTGTKKDCCWTGESVPVSCLCYSSSGSSIGTWACP